ncbi:MAG: hypothetical protein GXY77_16060 [Fibrobacter sp.]|nr:hypothetical protein [Fibrobacter sp.]
MEVGEPGNFHYNQTKDIGGPMLLSVEQARRILKDEDSEFEVYVNMFLREEKGVNLFYVVIKNKATGKKYKCSYWQGYKPSIDVYYKAFDRDKPEFTEVFDDMIEVESFLIRLLKMVQAYNSGEGEKPEIPLALLDIIERNRRF